MGGLFSNCCCGERGCTLRIVEARKTRHGFPPLWISSVVTGSTKKSRLRFLEKRISYKREYTSLGVLVPGEQSHYEVVVRIDRLTGRVDYEESYPDGDAQFAATHRGQALYVVDEIFKRYKGSTGNSTAAAFPPYYGFLTGDYTYVSTMDGVNVVGFTGTFLLEDAIERDFHSVEVTLGDPYDDETYQADLEDLLAGQLDTTPDNTVRYRRWNENGVNAALGDATTSDGIFLTAGAIAIDVTTLSAYLTPTDPELQTTDATITTWQGEADPADYQCAFEDEASIPIVETPYSNDSWTVAVLRQVRFYVATDVCSTFSRINGAGTLSERCQLDLSNGTFVDVIEPHAEAVADSNIDRSYFTTWGAFKFTTPGALTAGDCPCTAAP